MQVFAVAMLWDNLLVVVSEPGRLELERAWGPFQFLIHVIVLSRMCSLSSLNTVKKNSVFQQIHCCVLGPLGSYLLKRILVGFLKNLVSFFLTQILAASRHFLLVLQFP